MHTLANFLLDAWVIILFGFPGFVIASVAISLIIAVWKMYEEFTGREK